MECSNSGMNETSGGAGFSLPDRLQAEACSTNINGCPGHYEGRLITHTVHFRGEIIVIDHVPAEVCSECGDVLFKPETVRKIETILRQRTQPTQMVPLYEYA